MMCCYGNGCCIIMTSQIVTRLVFFFCFDSANANRKAFRSQVQPGWFYMGRKMVRSGHRVQLMFVCRCCCCVVVVVVYGCLWSLAYCRTPLIQNGRCGSSPCAITSSSLCPAMSCSPRSAPCWHLRCVSSSSSLTPPLVYTLVFVV